jgi:hypothetical protein
MSADTVTVIPTEIKAQVEKKPRAPRLPEKYGKFIQFAFYFMNKFNETAENKINEADYLSAIKLFGSIEEQQLVVENFFENSKENKKNINKFIKQQKNASTPKPERKPRAKKEKADTTTADGEAPKRARKKVTKAVNNTQDELINELVKRANSTEIVIEPVASLDPAVATTEHENLATDTKSKTVKKTRVKKSDSATEGKVETTTDVVPETKPKTEKKPRAKKQDGNTESNAQSSDSEPVKKQRKPRTKKNDNPPTTPIATQPELTTDDNSDDTTDVSIFEYHGKQFLIDDNNIVYDISTQDEIGHFDRSSNSLILL